MKNRNASAVSGGESVTIITAELKAEDHIIAKAKPIKIARKSIVLAFVATRFDRQRERRLFVYSYSLLLI